MIIVMRLIRNENNPDTVFSAVPAKSVTHDV